MKKLKKIPKFKTESEERKFWKSHDTTDYFDWSKAGKSSLSNLRKSDRNIATSSIIKGLQEALDFSKSEKKKSCRIKSL